MRYHNRSGNKWTVNEVLSLQREFELLGWDIDKIAEKHGRSPNAIMFKLDHEGFADYNVLYSNYHNLNAKIPVSRNSDTLVLDAVDSEDEENYDDDANDEDYADYEDNDDDDDDDDDDDCEDDDPLTARVAKVEASLDEIKTMLKTLTTQKQLNKLGF